MTNWPGCKTLFSCFWPELLFFGGLAEEVERLEQELEEKGVEIERLQEEKTVALMELEEQEHLQQSLRLQSQEQQHRQEELEMELDTKSELVGD